MTDRPGDGDAADGQDEAAQDDTAEIAIRLDALLSERQMTLTELSARVGVTIVNLSVLKNGRARAIRFSTLARLCRALDCQPGDLLRYHAGQPAETQAAETQPAETRPGPG
jgi:putative transcriptional regulator